MKKFVFNKFKKLVDEEAQKVISCGISSSADLSFSSKYTGEKNGNENPVGRRGTGFRENIDWSRVSRRKTKDDPEMDETRGKKKKKSEAWLEGTGKAS